jgi:hypothetical protein
MPTYKTLAVAVGKYTDGAGQEKNRYKNIGRQVTKDDGGVFLLLDADIFHASLFALANRERKDQIIVSMFEPRDQAAKPAAPAPGGVMEDDVPF